MNAAQQIVRQWEATLDDVFKERSDAVRVLMLSLLSGHNGFFLGPPGTGKSLLCEMLAQMIDGAKYFGTAIYAFTTPEDLFGPVSLKQMEHDLFRRVTSDFMPGADIVFLDEIFRGEEGVLSGLLWPLAAKKYKNGDQLIDMPMRCCVTAANSIPDGDDSLAALYDRLTLRCKVDPIVGIDNWIALIEGPKAPISLPPQIPIADLDAIVAEVQNMPVEPEVVDVLRELRPLLAAQGFAPTDRKWAQVIGDRDILGRPVRSVLKAMAWLNGRSSVQPGDLTCLYYTLWQTPDEIAKLVTTVGQRVNPLDLEAQTILNEAQEVYAGLEAVKQIQNDADRETKLGKLVADIKRVERKVIGRLQNIDRTSPDVQKLLRTGREVKSMRERLASLYEA